MHRSLLLASACLLAFAAMAPIQAGATSLEDIATQLARMEKDNAERIGKLEKENAELRKQIEKISVQKKPRSEDVSLVQPAATPSSRPRIPTNLNLQATSSQAMAEYVPLKAQPVSRSNDGLYVSLDSSYQSIALPNFGLGWQSVTAGGGVMDAYRRPRLDGYGVTGAIGYTFGGLSFLNSSNTRVEIGGSYVHATQKQTSGNPGTDLIFLVTEPYLLTGATQGIPCVQCATQSKLATDYAAWQLNMKFASDWISGPFTVTPSVAVFWRHITGGSRLSAIDRLYSASGQS